MPESVEVFAPAKVNLYLHVTGRRDDGYHLLDSLAVFAGVGDILRFAPAAGLSLTIDGPHAAGLQGEYDNIVLRAARHLAEVADVTAGAAIRLTKVLPVASGIGGGSADAAATLTGLCRLWSVAPDGLDAIALKLGADVPVCLAGRPAHMAGIGEHLTAAPVLPPAWLLLVNPRVGVATPAVFKARHGAFSPAMPVDRAPADAAALAAALAERRNDLTAPAIALVPVIGDLLAAIAATDGCLLSRMSGSGATCFGLFAAEAAARAAGHALATAHPEWWVAPAPILGSI